MEYAHNPVNSLGGNHLQRNLEHHQSYSISQIRRENIFEIERKIDEWIEQAEKLREANS